MVGVVQAAFSDGRVQIETIKIWKWDTGIPLLVLLTYGVSKFTENILILVSLQSVFAGIYFLILFLSFRKYKNAIKEHEKIYICYEKRIKKWYVEGKI